MLRFFRKIRQKLLAENQFTKYVTYAIGEIILVVIGILIALSINNENQRRIDKNEYQVLLQNLNKEFSENLIQLDSSVAKFDSVIDGLNKLLSLMITPEHNLTELEFDRILHPTFVTPNWTPSSFVLAELKNSGALSKLSNNDLKTLLFKWEREFDKMKQSNEGYSQYGSDYIEFITKNGSVRNLDALTESTKNLQRSRIAKNSPELLKNAEFENRADNFYFMAVQLRTQLKSLREIMISIIENSKAELGDTTHLDHKKESITIDRGSATESLPI